MRAGPHAIFRVRTVSIIATPSEAAVHERAIGLNPTIGDHIYLSSCGRRQVVPASPARESGTTCLRPIRARYATSQSFLLGNCTRVQPRFRSPGPCAMAQGETVCPVPDIGQISNDRRIGLSWSSYLYSFC